MINVLLLGDSIRLFYQNSVIEKLGDNYNVYGPDENCRFASYTLNSLRFYLSQFPTPDIIHWNAGLWDIAILYDCDGCFTPIDEYERNMKLILRELKKTGAKIIFATSTPVSEEKAFLKGPFPPAGKNSDIIEYNKRVIEAFSDENIEINDLFSIIYPKMEKYLSDDMVHPNDEGVEILSNAVCDKIKGIGNYKNQKSGTEEVKSEKIPEKTIQ